MRYRGRTVGIADKHIVGQLATIDCGIGITRRAAIEDFANDRQLARVERAIEHQLVELTATMEQIALQVPNLAGHMFGRSDRIATGIIDPDADVEPAVAIDDVVAFHAFDLVITTTAKDDVVRLVDNVGCNAIGIARQIGLVEHDHLMLLATGGSDRFTAKMAYQVGQSVDAVDAFCRQRIRIGQERCGCIKQDRGVR